MNGRPVRTVGGVNIFETSANSRYDALQLEVHGRLWRAMQYYASYSLSDARDDVSDVFDLAGASALPQNSLTRAGERGPANFDARHRFTYNFVYDVAGRKMNNQLLRLLFSDFQFASTGRYQTGQPFTVNSIFDVNLDGNLTDRLNTTDGIVVTGDRRQPLRLTTNNLAGLLAPVGQDGQIGRNTFRAGSTLNSIWLSIKRSPLRIATNLISAWTFLISSTATTSQYRCDFSKLRVLDKLPKP